MWSVRGFAIVAMVIALGAGDLVVAAGAGAALAREQHPSAAVTPLSTHHETWTARPRVTSTSTAARRPRITRARLTSSRRVVKRAVKPATPKLAAAQPPATTTTVPPTTVPPTTVPPPTSCPEVIASIVWPPGWQTICSGPRVGILGLTSQTGTTTLYVRPDESASFMRVVALHESGHAWDFARLNTNKIAQWCAARGCDPAHFFSGGAQGSGWSEPGGAEDWAASWDACHGGEFHRSYLGLQAPNASQCALQNSLVGYPA